MKEEIADVKQEIADINLEKAGMKLEINMFNVWSSIFFLAVMMTFDSTLVFQVTPTSFYEFVLPSGTQLNYWGSDNTGNCPSMMYSVIPVISC